MRQRGAAVAHLASDRQQQRHRLARRQVELETRAAPGEIGGRRIEREPRAPNDLVEASIGQHHGAALYAGRQRLPAPLALRAAHLEHVGEVGVERHPEIDRRRFEREVRQAQPLVAGAAPEKLRAKEVQLPTPQDQRAVTSREVGVGEIDGEQIVVFLDRRAQEQGAPAADAHLEAREEARAVMVEPLLAQTHRLHVAEPIEDRERLAVLEHTCAVIRARRRREDVKTVLVLEELVFHPIMPGAS